jgi:hypothetical protein
MRTALAALACVLVPALLHAQTDGPPSTRNDVTVSTGWIGARYRNVDDYRQWHGSLFGGANVGHYWTENLKTDVEAGWLSTTKAHSYESIFINGDRAFVQGDYVVKDLKLSVSQIFQFGHHAWVHPFLGAGVDLDHRRTAEDRPSQQAFVYPTGSGPSRSILIPGIHERVRAVRAVGFAKGGFKVYLSDRAFVVQEVKFGLDRGLDHLLWKTGLGIDF